ncbi:MAG: AAA family ATPase [Actinobacteria bacterium]|nr:AAA family ATPase [Actinomycetota bacterium]
MSTSLFDRAEEVDALRQAVEAAAEGGGGVTLIEAPPGFGKTSLCELAAVEASGRGVEVLAARGTELQEQVPFGLARVLLRISPGELGASPDRGLATIEQLAFACFERVVGADGEEGTPHLLIVDDAQWADRLSAAFLAHLIARSEGLPIAFLVASRPERSAGHGLIDELARSPATRLLRPGPLGPDATAAVVREECGEEVAASLIDACLESSGGSPLLVRELARELAAAGPSADVATVRDAAPATVMRAVISRLAHLGAGPAALAEAVAILEGSGSLEAAAELAGLDPETAGDAADALAEAGLLASDEPLDFAQPLIGAALRAEMGPFARARAHRRAAAVLEAEGAPVETVAAQLLHTRPAGDAETVSCLREAAALALGRGDATTAAGLLDRVLDEPPPEPERGEVLAELAEAEATAGIPAGAEHLAEALELLDDPTRRIAVCTALARTLHRAGRLAEATRIADLGRGAAAPEDPAVAELTAAWVASAMLYAELHAELEARLVPIVERAREGELPASPSLAAALGAWLAYRDEPAPLIRRLALAAFAADPMVDGDPRGAALGNAALALHSIDLLDEETRLLDDAVAVAEARGAVIARSVALHFRGMAALERGDLDRALTDAERALDVHRFGWDAPAWSSRTLTFIHIARDDLAAAADALAVGAGDDVGPAERMLVLEARAALRLAEERSEEALDDALESNRLAREVFGVTNARLFRASTLVPVAAAACGKADLARERAAETLALAREAESPRALGEALRAAAAAAPTEERTALLAEAVTVLETSAARLPRARAMLELGAAERAAGQRERAQETLRAALELADEIGAPRLVAEAREELRGLGRRPRRAARSGVDALTPSERRVADLAARGLSTPQIAHRLVITRKTVESHLGQAYRKLEIGGRAELAPILGERAAKDQGASP